MSGVDKMLAYIDTNIFIYLLEDNGAYSEEAADILDSLRSQGYEFVTSVITILEFMAGPVAVSAESILNVPRVRFIEVDEFLAAKSGLLQQKRTIHIGDAIHLATAEHVQAELFVTNDKELAKKLPKSIRPITLAKQDGRKGIA